VPELTVGVEVLHLRFLHVGRFGRVAGLEGALGHLAVLEIAHLDAVERLALARLDHLVFDDGVRVVFKNDLDARLEFIS
jgi:hypothetical protein